MGSDAWRGRWSREEALGVGAGAVYPTWAEQGPGADRANGSFVAGGCRPGRGGSGLAFGFMFRQVVLHATAAVVVFR